LEAKPPTLVAHLLEHQVNILWIDPFHGGSHAAVASGYMRHSRHHVTLLTLDQAGGWRWRMRGAAVTLARRLRELPDLHSIDLIVTTDMLDLATLLGLTRDILPHTPVALYFHENQLTYPLPRERKLDLSLPWINYTSAIAADRICFNSAFHRDIFLRELVGLPGRFHDHQELDLLAALREKSIVLYPGLELETFGEAEPQNRRAAEPILEQKNKRAKEQKPTYDLSNEPKVIPTMNHIGANTGTDDGLLTTDHSKAPTILWNSRWEYDKNPGAFFEALLELERRGVDFRVIVAGEHIDPNEATFAAAKEHMATRTIWWGYAPDPAFYRGLLRQADIVVSTAIQEFFGIAVLEAVYAGCVPVLPRRLSYPELIPAALHADCLYDSDASLADRLARTIQDLGRIRQLGFRQAAARFDWRTQATIYDREFERIVSADDR
jgi:glycosyltransferase involved in cell wall biosynthesis